MPFIHFLMTYPGAIISFVGGLLLFVYNLRESKKEKEKEKKSPAEFAPFSAVLLRGFVVSIILIIYGLIILYFLIFTNDFENLNL